VPTCAAGAGAAGAAGRSNTATAGIHGPPATIVVRAVVMLDHTPSWKRGLRPLADADSATMNEAMPPSSRAPSRAISPNRSKWPVMASVIWCLISLSPDNPTTLLSLVLQAVTKSLAPNGEIPGPSR